MSRPFNYRQIKRRAHLEGRSNPTWLNPFGHSWSAPGGQNRRRDTWDGRRETWDGTGDVEAGSPIAHNSTAPARYGVDELAPEDTGAAGVAGSQDEVEGVSRERLDEQDFKATAPTSKPDGKDEDTAPEPQSTHIVPDDGLHWRGKLPKVSVSEHPGLPGPSSPDIYSPTRPKKTWNSWFYKPVFPKEPFTIANQIFRVFFRHNSFVFLCLLCSPIGFVLNFTVGQSVETFVLNFVATFALNVIGEMAMSEIALRTGETLGELLSISTDNLVQFISCIILLLKGQVTVLQTSLVGAILANILFFLGLSILCGGINRQYQYINQNAAQMSSNMLSLASTSILIPTASLLLSQAKSQDLVKQSRGASIVLVLVYALYLVYQYGTHRAILTEPSQKMPARPISLPLGSKPIPPLPQGAVQGGAVVSAGLVGGLVLSSPVHHEQMRELVVGSPLDFYQDEDEDDEPQLHIAVALAVFAGATALLYFNIDYAVNSIDALTAKTGLTNSFVGLVLFPLSNLNHVPIVLAVKDQLSQTITVTVGKSIQTALLVTPSIVLLAWWVGNEQLSLVFDGFEVVSLFATVLLLNLIIAEGRVQWIQGVLLLADWALVSIAAYFVTQEVGKDLGTVS